MSKVFNFNLFIDICRIIWFLEDHKYEYPGFDWLVIYYKSNEFNIHLQSGSHKLQTAHKKSQFIFTVYKFKCVRFQDKCIFLSDLLHLCFRQNNCNILLIEIFETLSGSAGLGNDLLYHHMPVDRVKCLLSKPAKKVLGRTKREKLYLHQFDMKHMTCMQSDQCPMRRSR